MNGRAMRPDRLTSDTPATGQIVPRHAGPPWRTLGLLAAGVLAAHALVLQTQPPRFGTAQVQEARRVAALTTRSIPATQPVPANPPARAVAAPAQPAAKAARPAKKPVYKPKVPVAQDPPAQPAIDSIADSIQEPGHADRIQAPPEPDSAAPLPFAPASEAALALRAESGTAPATVAPASAAAAPAPTSQTPVTAMALPPSAQLAYRMTGSAKGLTYHAKGEMAWQSNGASYSASMTVKALFLGSRTMSSAGNVSDQGLAPTRFADRSKNEVAAHFEPDKGQISFSANTPAVPWVQGAQDRVSVFMQLGGMLAGNPAGFPAGSTISTLTVGPRSADNWTFRVEGEELLSLPFGDLATLKVSRQPRREYDQTVEIWYAPALGYLPVRNRITQANGDFVDQELSGLSRP